MLPPEPAQASRPWHGAHEVVPAVLQPPEVLPDVRERLSALGFEPIASTPEEFADRIRWEIDKWAKVIRAANIKAQ